MPFIVISSQRSGSNLLLSSLNSHPNILCDNELFLQRYWKEESNFISDKKQLLTTLVENENNNNITPFSNYTHYDTTKEKQITKSGMLIKYNQLEDTDSYLPYLFENFKIIHITRKNVIDRAISHLIIDMKRKQQETTTGTISPEYSFYYKQTKEKKITIAKDTIEKLKDTIDKEKTREKLITKLIRKNSKQYIELTYEDLTNNNNVKSLPETITQQLCNFLEVPNNILTPKIIKNKYTRPENIIKNYDRVMLILRRYVKSKK